MFAGLKAVTTLSFLVMIAVNALANILPINGVGTGDVSDSYPDLFAPAGVTFAIWGLIYILLGGYTLYQLGIFGTSHRFYQKPSMRKVAVYFSISSIANTLWIFAWHYDFIGLSLILMLVILASLLLIMEQLRTAGFWLKVPFSIYFGWITVATIANITTWLVSIGWQGSGVLEVTWTVLVLIVGLLISGATMLNHRDAPYGWVIIWAYAGIGLKHISENGFASVYPSVITTVMACIIALVAVQVYLLVGRTKGHCSWLRKA